MKTKFQEMFEKDVNSKVEKKNGLSYLSWAFAWAEVKKIDENADYTIHENANGDAFFASSLGIDCKVSVTIHGKTHTMRLPVMDGANKAMKTEAYTYTVNKYGKTEEKTVQAATSFDVNKTIMRCLVKAIAMHGLGLYIYAGEDLPEEQVDAKQEQKTAPNLKAAMAVAKETGEKVKVEANPEEKLVAANPENNVNAVPAKKGWGKKSSNTQPTGGDLY